MNELALTQEEHRTPDGSRPLVIGRVRDGLDAIQHAGEPTACYMARHNATHQLPPPAGCREQIEPGDYALRHTETDIDGNPVVPARVSYWCPPCAIREWRWWDVNEAAGDA